MNPMAFLFSYMDRACTAPSEKPGINKAYSFVPEWGMAPSRDDRDKREYDDSAFVSDEECDETLQPARASTRAVKDEIHENFEMVLEDLASTEEDLAHQKQQRNWMGAMNFRKNADKAEKRETEERNEKRASHQIAADDAESAGAVKGGPERIISPLTMEEEKKEEEILELDSDNDEEPTKGPSGARKMGNKILMSFRRLKKPKGDLPPVSEGEEFDEGAPSETSGFKVRVPETNKALSETDLIGDDVVQDIYRDLEATIDPTTRPPELVQTQQQKTPNPLSTDNRAESPLSQSTVHSEMPSKGQTRSTDDENEEDSTYPDGHGNNMLTSIMSLLNGGNQKEMPPEVRKIPDKGDIPKSKSWVDQFRLTLSDDTYDTPPASSAKRQEANDRQQMASQQKMLWREVSDPKTGRPYYYHRITREVTWKKPQEMTEYEESRKGTEKGNDRRLVSVLSDGDLAAAAARDEKSRSEAAMRKKNARDFDPDIWAVKEQIVKLLQTMEPPDGSSVEEVLKQYEGREELLLQQLRNMKEARPFDEPVASDEKKRSEYKKVRKGKVA
uniref:WW domain-containing protein n=1 Tax=Amphora coffeiformis TaxID=265554 RepID=A0A7S3P7I5_9STRA